MHDCASARCHKVKSVAVIQERSKSSQTRQLIDHEETNQWILNQNSLHNYQEIAAVLPSDLAPYVPSVENCNVVELRRHAASSIRSKKGNADGQFEIAEDNGTPAPAFDKSTRSRKKKPAGNQASATAPIQYNSPQPQPPNPPSPIPETPVRSSVDSAIHIENSITHLRNPMVQMETSNRHSNHHPSPMQAQNPPLQQRHSALPRPHHPLLPTNQFIHPFSYALSPPSHQASQRLSTSHAPPRAIHMPTMAPDSHPGHPATLQQQPSFAQHQSTSFRQQPPFPGQFQSNLFQPPPQGSSHPSMSASHWPLQVHPRLPAAMHSQWPSTTPPTHWSFPQMRHTISPASQAPVSQPAMFPQNFPSTGWQFMPPQTLSENRLIPPTTFHQPRARVPDDAQSFVFQEAGPHLQRSSATLPAPQSVLQTGYVSQQFQASSLSASQSSMLAQYPMEYPTTDTESR